MLLKTSRLSSNYDFNRVKRHGQGLTTPFFGLYYMPARQPGKTRFGIIVTNKLDRRAVYRNRVRRLLRRAINANPFKNDYDVVIVAFRRSLTASYEEISDSFNQTLSKTPLL